jgi:hypothetical protein
MTYKQALRDFQRDYWVRAMAAAGNSVTQASVATGVPRRRIYVLLRLLDVDPPRRVLHRGNWGSLTH